MTVARSAATVMLEEVRSVMRWSVPLAPSAVPRAADSRLSPLQQVRHATGAEVPDVDALGRSDPDPALEWLVHMTEKDIPGLSRCDHIEKRLTPPFHSPRHRVVEELGHGRRDMSAQYVHVTHRCHLRCVHVVVELVGGPVGRTQPAADKAERPPGKLDPLAVEDALPWLEVSGPQKRQIHIPVSQ